MSDDVNESAKVRSNSSEVFSGILSLQSQEIPFAHFAHHSNLKNVLKVMIEEWNLQIPKIMVVLVSDYASLSGWPDIKEQERFVKGLIKASNATSMWIVTNGLNIGLSKVIGDAFDLDFKKRYAQFCYSQSEENTEVKKTPLIGVCRDTVLTYYDSFKNLEKRISLQNLGNKPDEHKFDLNAFHTNILLIRDRTAHKSAVNRFLLKLEDALRGFYESTSGEETNTFIPTSPVPVIAILVQGNINAVHYILAHLKRKLPILIIRGSGGLADILAYAYYEVQRNFEKIKDLEYVENIMKKSLSDKITAVFPSLKDNKMAHCLLCDRVLECVQSAEPPQLKYITVFSTLDLDRDIEDLPSHMLETIFKAQLADVSNYHDHLKRDLLLTIDWNCPQLAVTKVFYKDPSFMIENDVFEQTLLSKDREEFISMFLDHGFEIHKYMNSSRVITLFENALNEDFFREVCWERLLGYRKVMMLDDYFIDSDLNWIIENLLDMPIYVSSRELNECSIGIFNMDCPEEIASDVARRKAITVLIIWALVSNRGKLAVYLWKHGDRPVMLALACSIILSKMQQYITDTTLKENCAKLSEQFSDMAVGVFDLCYNDMPAKAYDALSLKNKDWGGHSLIDMAALAQNKNLVAHPCCQKWLTNTFMGNVKIRDLNWGFIKFPTYFKVILCAFFVYPMYLWVRFKEPSEDEFLGSSEYEVKDPYYISSDLRTKNKNINREEIGRSHLLKYHYPHVCQMIYWMWSAPITKFWISNIFYVIYLAIFSMAVIWTSCGNVYLDLLICIWTSLIALESAHKMYSLKKAFPNTKMFGYSLEIIYILMYAIFLFFFRVHSFKDPYGGKILMCLGLLFFYYRMIFIYLPISSTLGPLLYRVKEMVSVDFINFMKLVVLILIANAIAMQAILYPDYPLSIELVRKSFHKAFIAFFMTPVEELIGTEPFCKTWEQKPTEGTMCRVSNYIDGRCSSGIAFWPYIIVFQYMLLLKLILLTILFALFSNTGSKFAAESNSLWKLQRYHLVTKFSVSLRLPPPLNIFSLISILYKSIKYLYKWIYDTIMHKTENEADKMSNEGYFSELEYNYWKQLARDFYDKEEYKKKEEEYTEKEADVIGKLLDDVNLKEDLIYRAKSQIAQLEADIGYTHAHLETLKYREKKDEEQKVSISLHSLSRESPYPRTKIQRFPVPDKYVPWEVMWLHYEPNTYTMPKSDFTSLIQPFVDEDILMMKQRGMSKDEIPIYLWNMESIDDNVYRNRKSWIVDSRGKPLTYRLDLDELPRNPMGRTGLRGKGALPRWGPNHNIFVVITRWQRRVSKGSEHSLLGTADLLEFVVTWYMHKKEISLPGGFAWSESQYKVIQSIFKLSDDAVPWLSADDMIQFFKRHSSSSVGSEPGEQDIKCSNISCGYMDDQSNTDQAWKEVELWHIHYYNYTSIFHSFKANMKWRVLSEDVFIRLPYGQTTLLQDVIRTFETNMTYE
ncbi:transient receptor potential cation channel subfamily M member 2 [Nephila pilipes]|uniref:Transient receptor potential cation channel subfamily M member 2 n=1 Tax=Nephila pilipes TaxID=299642 RepID=A0A8X6NNC7_NEPPI|nr:transient receptor potential cation channel subfamily M member 2 [Nephila pilipes]